LLHVGTRRNLCQVSIDHLKQFSCAVGLRDIGIAACRVRLFFVAAERVGGDDDDWNMAEIRLCLYAPCRLVSVKNRQLDIHQDQVRALGSRCYERSFAVVRLDHFVTDACEQIAQNLPIILLIFQGPTTAASQQVWDLYIIPDMFAQYATGRMTLDQAISWGEKEMLAIYNSKRRT
jgi:hypothetical protein